VRSLALGSFQFAPNVGPVISESECATWMSGRFGARLIVLVYAGKSYGG
jgi:hypothetical protein